jgi:hypothetical protein
VASVQLTTCFHLVLNLRISGALLHTPKHLHDVQSDILTCKFKRDTPGQSSLGQVSVTASECNANWKVTISFSKTVMLQGSWKSNKWL